MKTAFAALVLAVLPVQNEAPQRMTLKAVCDDTRCIVQREDLVKAMKAADENAKARFACENAQRT